MQNKGFHFDRIDSTKSEKQKFFGLFCIKTSYSFKSLKLKISLISTLKKVSQ